MLRCCVKFGACGVVLGLLVVVVAGIARMPDAYTTMTVMLGGILAVGSGIVVASAVVSRVSGRAGRPVEDAYEHGLEQGYERGWRDCARRNMRPGSLNDRRRRDA